jgi:protein-S-isoprenylcysteine O-methyltransferase Ste14
MASQRDNAGVIAPPPLIVLAALLIGFGLEYLWPSPALPNVVGYSLGGLLALIGFGSAISALFGFRRAGTNAEPWQPTTALVADGPYRFTRNPMYLGLALVHLGVAAAFGGLWVAAMLVPALITLRYGVIAREERYLEAKFGDAYRDYMASVRRWF